MDIVESYYDYCYAPPLKELILKKENRNHSFFFINGTGREEVPVLL